MKVSVDVHKSTQVSFYFQKHSSLLHLVQALFVNYVLIRLALRGVACC